MLLLIDGDQIVHKAAAAVETEVRWDEENHVLYSNAGEVWNVAEGMVDRILERFDVRTLNAFRIAFSSSPIFRTKLFPEYKAGRGRKPLCFAMLKKRVQRLYPCVSKPNLEADDILGILATKPGNEGSIIVAQDKDMKTIPATIWDGKDLVTYTQAQADYWHLFQTLTGDSSDGYKGCPGIGTVRAGVLLKGSPSYATVETAFLKAGLTKEDALLQARLARILRWSDWDSKKQEPILWTPTSAQ